MLWPIVLPLKIAFWALAGFVLVATVLSPVRKWKRGKTFVIALLVACIAFIPLCAGIMSVIDSKRFGIFHYDAYSDVQDFRVERYLPTHARDITLEKFAMGHRAKYTITQIELTAFLDSLWSEAGEFSAIRREQLPDGSTVAAEYMALDFDELDWALFQNALQFHSPVQSDGGGATYYFDPTSNTTYHRAGYW